LCFFFFNDTATTEIYTLSLHDALPIWQWEATVYLLVVQRTLWKHAALVPITNLAQKCIRLGNTMKYLSPYSFGLFQDMENKKDFQSLRLPVNKLQVRSKWEKLYNNLQQIRSWKMFAES